MRHVLMLDTPASDDGRLAAPEILTSGANTPTDDWYWSGDLGEICHGPFATMQAAMADAWMGADEAVRPSTVQVGRMTPMGLTYDIAAAERFLDRNEDAAGDPGPEETLPAGALDELDAEVEVVVRRWAERHRVHAHFRTLDWCRGYPLERPMCDCATAAFGWLRRVYPA